MKKIIRKVFNQLGYDIVKLPPTLTDDDRSSVPNLFSAIYDKNLWGGQEGQFYSGPGSDNSVSLEYVKVIRQFMADNNIGTVLDIGCGDFRVGRQIVSDNFNYIGIDIVPKLVERNRKEFGNPNIEFHCLNAIEDELPNADLCLIRQVLQHLSNAQIEIILEKCKKYQHLIITEHILTAPDVVFNLDMPASDGIRAENNSGLFLEHSPFNLKVKKLLEVNSNHEGIPDSAIRTLLILR